MFGGGLNSLIPPKNSNDNGNNGQQNPVAGGFGNQNYQPQVNQPQSNVNFNSQPVQQEPSILHSENSEQQNVVQQQPQEPIVYQQPEIITEPVRELETQEEVNQLNEFGGQLNPENNLQNASSFKETYDDSDHDEYDRYHHDVKRPFGKKVFLNDAIFHIEVDKITPNPFQPRKQFDEEALGELASSIREYGILQPLVVSKIIKDTNRGTEVEYQLIAGERRLRAAKMVGLERVPVIIRQMGEKKEHLELAIIENLQRANLDMIETARAYSRLQDEFGLTQREIAVRMGKSREAISNTLRLLSLPTEIQQALSENKISESQARLLLSVANPAAQRQLLVEILTNNLSVRDLKSRIQRMENPDQAKLDMAHSINNGAREHELQLLEKKLKEILGTEVKIDVKGEGGKIVISFYSPEEVYGLVDKINPGAHQDL